MAFDVMLPLREVLAELAHENDVRAVVLTGAGRGFSSGADHKSAGSVPHVAGLTRPSFGLRSMQVLDDVILAMRKLPQPIIAAVNGAPSVAGCVWRWRQTFGSPPVAPISARPGSTTD